MSEEFSIPIAIAELSPQGVSVKRQANALEKAALAQRLAVESVEKMAVDISIVPGADGQTARVDGSLDATIRQICSVTLEPLMAKHRLAVCLRFADSDLIKAHHVEEIDTEESDPPEPIFNGRFDAGDTLVQLLAVDIDPFPRKPGVSLEDVADGAKHIQAPEDTKSNPFAVLSKFRDKLEEH